jgi:hypothetical protein
LNGRPKEYGAGGVPGIVSTLLNEGVDIRIFSAFQWMVAKNRAIDTRNNMGTLQRREGYLGMVLRISFAVAPKIRPGSLVTDGICERVSLL